MVIYAVHEAVEDLEKLNSVSMLTWMFYNHVLIGNGMCFLFSTPDYLACWCWIKSYGASRKLPKYNKWETNSAYYLHPFYACSRLYQFHLGPWINSSESVLCSVLLYKIDYCLYWLWVFLLSLQMFLVSIRRCMCVLMCGFLCRKGEKRDCLNDTGGNVCDCPTYLQ